MRKSLYLVGLVIMFIIISSGCVREKKALSPEELKEEIARTEPEKGFQSFEKGSVEKKQGSLQKGEDSTSDVSVIISSEKKESPDISYGEPEEFSEAIALSKPRTPVISEEEKEVVPEPVPEETTEDEKIPPKKTEPSLSEKKLISLDRWNGECLVYQLTWNSIRFGKGMLACKEASNGYGDVYHIVGLTIPEGTIAGVGIGLHRMDAFIDRKTLLPHYYYQYDKNKNKEDILEIHFDWNKKQYRTRYRKFDTGKLYSTKEKTVEIESKLPHDGISIFYFVRTLDLEKNEFFAFPIAFKEMWDLTIKNAGKRIEDIPSLGKQEVYVLKPQAKSNEGFFTKGTMDLWLTADNRRLPVYLEGRVPLGKARMLFLSEEKLAPDAKLDSDTITDILSRCN